MQKNAKTKPTKTNDSLKLNKVFGELNENQKVK